MSADKVLTLRNVKHSLSLTALVAGTRIIHKISEFSCEITHYGKSLISDFQEFFDSINKTSILAGGLGTTLSLYDV